MSFTKLLIDALIKADVFPQNQDLLGIKVQVLFNVQKGKKQQWYDGRVTKLDDALELMYISFEDGDEQAYTLDEAMDAVANEEIRFVELIDLSSDD